MNDTVPKLSTETRIKLKYKEWEVEITCTEDKVKQVVENVLSGMDIALMYGMQSNNEIEKIREEVSLLKTKIEASDNYSIHQRKSNRRSEEHTSELQSRQYLVCRLLLEKKKQSTTNSRLFHSRTHD